MTGQAKGKYACRFSTAKGNRQSLKLFFSIERLNINPASGRVQSFQSPQFLLLSNADHNLQNK